MSKFLYRHMSDHDPTWLSQHPDTAMWLFGIGIAIVLAFGFVYFGDHSRQF